MAMYSVHTLDGMWTRLHSQQGRRTNHGRETDTETDRQKDRQTRRQTGGQTETDRRAD